VVDDAVELLECREEESNDFAMFLSFDGIENGCSFNFLNELDGPLSLQPDAATVLTFGNQVLDVGVLTNFEQCDYSALEIYLSLLAIRYVVANWIAKHPQHLPGDHH
jgi:hypothetical protein